MRKHKTKVRNTEIEAKARHGTPGMKCSLPSIYLDFRVRYLDFAVRFRFGLPKRAEIKGFKKRFRRFKPGAVFEPEKVLPTLPLAEAPCSVVRFWDVFPTLDERPIGSTGAGKNSSGVARCKLS